jgi:Secretion system C-terminal sorting domain
MKNLLFYLLFLSTSISAQWVNFTNVYPSSYSNNSIDLDRNIHLEADSLGFTALKPTGYGIEMSRYHASGQLSFDHIWGAGSRLGQMQHAGTSFFISSFDFDCDYPLGLFFRCLDSTGTELWELEFELSGEWEPYHFIPANNGHWWLWRQDQSPQLIDGITGAVIDSLLANRPSIRNYRVLSDGQVVAFSNMGLLRYNGDFELTGTALSDQVIESLYQSEDRLLAYGEGKLFLLNETLNVLAEANIGQLTGTGNIQLAMRGDQVFVSRFDGNSAKWLEFDLSLQLVTQDNYPDQLAFNPQGFTLFDNHWLIAGTSQGYINVLKSVEAPYPGYEHQMDVELRSAVATDSMKVTLDYAPFGNWVTVKYKADSVWATVKNNSPIAIDRFRVGWYTNTPPVWCNSGIEIAKTYLHPLAPGDSTTVLVKNITYYYSTLASLFNGVQPQISINLFTDLPQDSLDTHKGNSALTATFLVENVVSVPITFAPNEVSIHPNPINDELWIEVGNKVFDVEIYDELGRLLHRATNQIGSSRWDRGQAPAGMYWVRVLSGAQAGVYKVVGL